MAEVQAEPVVAELARAAEPVVVAEPLVELPADPLVELPAEPPLELPLEPETRAPGTAACGSNCSVAHRVRLSGDAAAALKIAARMHAVRSVWNGVS